jgi:hypothetical protein
MAAFVFFGLALGIVPGAFLEGVYRMDDAGDTGWVRLFGATLLGVGYMEIVLIQNLRNNLELARAWIAVPLLLTVAFAYTAIAGVDVFNDAFNLSSLAITTFFTLGHLWFRRPSMTVVTLS